MLAVVICLRVKYYWLLDVSLPGFAAGFNTNSSGLCALSQELAHLQCVCMCLFLTDLQEAES